MSHVSMTTIVLGREWIPHWLFKLPLPTQITWPKPTSNGARNATMCLEERKIRWHGSCSDDCRTFWVPNCIRCLTYVICNLYPNYARYRFLLFYDEKTGSERQGEMPTVTQGWDSSPVCLILKFIYFSLCYSSFDSLDFHLFLQLNISHG